MTYSMTSNFLSGGRLSSQVGVNNNYVYVSLLIYLIYTILQQFDELKIDIVTAARNAPHMREPYPIKWLSFQRAFVAKVAEGTTHMTLHEVNSYDKLIISKKKYSLGMNHQNFHTPKKFKDK